MCTEWLHCVSPALQSTFVAQEEAVLCRTASAWMVAVWTGYVGRMYGMSWLLLLTTDHTLFPAEGRWPHSSSWEQRDLNYLGLSWIKEASIATTFDGRHKLHTTWGWEHIASSIFIYLPEHSNFCLVCLRSVDCCNVLKTDLWRTQMQIIRIKGNRGSTIRDQCSWAGSCSVPWDSKRKDKKKKVETRSNEWACLQKIVEGKIIVNQTKQAAILCLLQKEANVKRCQNISWLQHVHPKLHNCSLLFRLMLYRHWWQYGLTLEVLK